MIDLGQYSTIRQAAEPDRTQLGRLLGRKSTVHRHLDWMSPLDWLGRQPFYLLEDHDGTFLAALACPADEAGLVWLRLFASLPGFPLNQAWDRLWTAARDWLGAHQPGSAVNALAIRPEMEILLQRGGFQEISRVVALQWEIQDARWPSVRENLVVRDMTPEDIPTITRLDQAAFQPLWQHTPAQLQAAYREAFSSTVVLLNAEIAGYQISTVNPQGGHLARLAVDPGLQGQGLGIRLLDDLLDRFSQAGIVAVSVNTQGDNQHSLRLYAKFGFRREDEVYPVLQYSA